jgi:hypothetical protein
MLTAQQLVSLACAEAKVPSYLALAGQKLNMVLAELCSFDLDVNRNTTNFVFDTGLGSGPYTLPNDWLRSNRDDVFYVIDGVRYVMVPVSMSEFDALIQTAGLQSYPTNYAVDNSPISTQGAPNLYVWPPPSGAFPVTARYYRQMADIISPELSSQIPWFPNQLYLQRRLTGEMLLIANDDRAAMYLNGETGTKTGTFLGASAILQRYLKNKDDSQVVRRITLDRRFFGSNLSKLPPSKITGF